jgi:hypothetical protein
MVAEQKKGFFATLGAGYSHWANNTVLGRSISSEMAAIVNFIFSHVLFWVVGFTTALDYGYDESKLGDEGETVSGERGSGVVIITGILVGIATLIFVVKFTRTVIREYGVYKEEKALQEQIMREKTEKRAAAAAAKKAKASAAKKAAKPAASKAKAAASDAVDAKEVELTEAGVAAAPAPAAADAAEGDGES